MSEMAMMSNSNTSDKISASDQFDFEEINIATDQNDLIDNDSTSLSTNKSGFPLSWSACRMIDERVLKLSPMLPLDPIPNPVDTEIPADIDETDLDNLRRFIQKQFSEGSKWSDPLMFKGFLNSMVPGPVNVSVTATFTGHFGLILCFCCRYGNIY